MPTEYALQLTLSQYCHSYTVAVFAAEFAYTMIEHGTPYPGPKNMLTTEGSINISINCPFAAPIWHINSTLYKPLSLPPPFELPLQA